MKMSRAATLGMYQAGGIFPDNHGGAAFLRILYSLAFTTCILVLLLFFSANAHADNALGNATTAPLSQPVSPTDATSQTKLHPSSGPPVSPPPSSNGTLGIRLADVIYLSIRNNVSARTKYLDRVLEKFDLHRAESKFIPNVNLDGTANIQASEKYKKKTAAPGEVTDQDKWNAGGLLSVTEKVPTGAEITFIWDNTHEESLSNHNEGGTTSTMALTIEQPLLKGAGTEYNRASVRLARITEQRNVLTLRDTLSGLINTGIDLFYAYVQASENLGIQLKALERSKRLLEVNRIKVDMGRMAASDMIQAEADVASRELQIEEARNSLDNARRQLLNHLELDPGLKVRPIQGRDYPETRPTFENCMKLALRNNRSYLGNVFSLREAEIKQTMVINERKWDLRAGVGVQETLSGQIDDSDYRENEWKAQLKLEAPINLYGGNLLDRKRSLLSARITKRKAELELNKAKIDLQTRVANAVRNVNIRLKLIQLSKNDRKLKEIQLRNEQTKLMAGRSTNFQVVTYQDQLLEAERNEVRKVIAYVQALTALDQILGTTMGTWGIEFRHENKQLEERLGDEIRPLVWTWW